MNWPQDDHKGIRILYSSCSWIVLTPIAAFPTQFNTATTCFTHSSSYAPLLHRIAFLTRVTQCPGREKFCNLTYTLSGQAQPWTKVQKSITTGGRLLKRVTGQTFEKWLHFLKTLFHTVPSSVPLPNKGQLWILLLKHILQISVLKLGGASKVCILSSLIYFTPNLWHCNSLISENGENNGPGHLL